MNAEILFVDDDPDILAGFQRTLRKTFKIETAVGAQQALTLARSREPFSVVVADMRMPGMNGVEFLIELEKFSPETVRIMLTGNADQKTARDAVNEGHVFRFLTKPCPPEELIPTLNAALKQYQLITAERQLLEQTLNGSARMLSDILAIHDPLSFGMSQGLRQYMRAFAGHFQLKQTWDLELAATLSQIGCVTIPQPVLERWRNGRALSAPETDLIRRIPQMGHDLLQHIPRLESVADIILYQGKNYDGTGFPLDKKSGEDIPIGARILHVLLDLMTQEAQGSRAKALDSMAKSRSLYDPHVLESVAAVFDICIARPVAATAAPHRAVSIKELRVSSILAADARTKDGFTIAATGTEVSPMLLQKLRNFAELGNLEQPLMVAG